MSTPTSVKKKTKPGPKPLAKRRIGRTISLPVETSRAGTRRAAQANRCFSNYVALLIQRDAEVLA